MEAITIDESREYHEPQLILLSVPRILSPSVKPLVSVSPAHRASPSLITQLRALAATLEHRYAQG